jgi:hypothetical protein
MSDIHERWLAAQRRRWMRPNAERFTRPDAARFMRPDAERYMRPDADRFLQPWALERKRAPRPAENAGDGLSDWEFEAEVRWLRCELASLKVDLALQRFAAGHSYKANFDPNQPRVPVGNPDGGQWASEGGAGERPRVDERTAGPLPPGIGHNQGPLLGDPPEIPKTEPPTRTAKNDFIKAAAKWLSAARAVGARISGFVAAYEALSWLDTDRPFIESYQDPPKSLEELRQAVSPVSKRGYQDHHVNERDAAKKAKFPNSLIDGSDNVVRIPTLKHWEITGWYMRRNEKFGNMSPRDYLEDKSWDERTRVGLEALVEHGVLKQ